MHFRVSSFSAAACVVLVLHVSCFTGNTTAQLQFSLPTAPRVGDNGASAAGKLQPGVSVDLNGPSIAGKLRPDVSLGAGGVASVAGNVQPDVSVDLNGPSIAGKLRPDVSLGVGGVASIAGNVRPDVALDVDVPSVAGKLQPDVSLDVNVPSVAGNVRPDVTLDGNRPSIAGNVQPGVALDVDVPSVAGKLQPNVSLDVNVPSVAGNVRPDVSLDVGGVASIAGNVRPDVSLDVNRPSIAGNVQPGVALDVDVPSVAGKLQPNVSLDVNVPSVAGNVRPDVSLDVGGVAPIAGNVRPDVSLDVNRPSIAGNLQPDVSLDLNVPSVAGNVRPDVALDVDGPSIAGKLQPDVSLGIDGAPTIGNLLPNISLDVGSAASVGGNVQSDISLDVNVPSVSGNVRPDVSLNINGASVDGKTRSNASSDDDGTSTTTEDNSPIVETLPGDTSSNNVAYDVQDATTTESPAEETKGSTDAIESTTARWIQKVNRAKSLRPSAQTAATRTGSKSPLVFGQVIANVLYGAPWSSSRASPKCSADMKTYNKFMQNSTLWAVKMLDATSKGPEGILDGNVFSFGNFEECISVKSKNLGISGGYSLVDIDFWPNAQLYPEHYDNDHSEDYDPLDEDESAWKAIKHNIQEDYIQRHKFQWAVCLPDTCDAGDVQKIVSNVLIPELNRHGLDANVTIDPLLHTSNQNVYKYTAGFYLVCAMYLALCGLVFAGTLYDFVYLQYRPKSEHGPMKKVMKPFSLISNIERLLKPSETEEFSIINGLKVCAILQVIVGHRWFLEFGNPQMNPNFTHWLIHNFWFGYFKCSIFLETFFVISGFLTFYIITKHLVEKKTLNFIPIMIYRWLRIFPVYGTLIVTYIFILPYLNEGPYWRKIIYRESERCQSNWWANVLYINNYVNTDELCIIPSWYLTCDMHFFIVGSLLTYTIWKWRKAGLVLLGTCLTLSTIIPAYIIINEQHRGTPAIDPKSLEDLSKDIFYTKVYIKSHMRSMTYFVGILAGYIYMQLKEADYKLSLKSRAFWAPVVLLTGNLIYLSSGIFFVLGHTYVDYEHAIYFTVGRLVWSILIAYGIIGHGLSGFGVCISGFLGHRVFHVVGKLVFCIYMFQEISQLQTISSMKTPTYQNMTIMTWKFCGDVLNALMYAFAINVMIESPFDRLQKRVMKIFVGAIYEMSWEPQILSTTVATESSRKVGSATSDAENCTIIYYIDKTTFIKNNNATTRFIENPHSTTTANGGFETKWIRKTETTAVDQRENRKQN